MKLTSEEIRRLLHLAPHPTCGWVAQAFRSPHELPQSVLPEGYSGARPAGSVLTFMVTPDRATALHRIPSDQMYHFYLGDPLEVLLLFQDGRGHVAVVGPDLAAGMRPQLLIPGGTFHMSRVRRGGSFSLLGTSEWIGVEPADVEKGDPEQLVREYPGMQAEIRDFARQLKVSAA